MRIGIGIGTKWRMGIDQWWGQDEGGRGEEEVDERRVVEGSVFGSELESSSSSHGSS